MSDSLAPLARAGASREADHAVDQLVGDQCKHR